MWARRTLASVCIGALAVTGLASTSAEASVGPSGVSYDLVVTCATASVTVRSDARSVPGSGPVTYTISAGTASKDFIVNRGSSGAVTVDGQIGIDPGGVTVTEAGSKVGFIRYTDVCGDYTNTQATAPISQFVPVSPARILDTRPESLVNYSGAKPAANTQFNLVVTGKEGIPANASAVVLNVTATAANGPGYVQLFPTNQGMAGSSSNLNLEAAGQTIPNAVIVPIGDGGAVTFFTQVGTHVLADVAGYFVPVTAAVTGGRLRGISPTRVLDTRAVSPINYSGAKPGAGSIVTFPVTGLTGGPTAAQVSAVVLNVTATEATAPGYVQVAPGGALVPGKSSNLNIDRAGQTIPNLVIVPVAADGTVSIFTQSGTNLIADVTGYFTSATEPASVSGLFLPLTPERVADTRDDDRRDGSAFGGDPNSQFTMFFGGLPQDELGAVMLNVTATQAVGAGYVQIGPDLVVGKHSNLNVERAGQTIPNAVLVPVSNVNELDLYTQSGTQLIVDIFGWFLA